MKVVEQSLVDYIQKEGDLFPEMAMSSMSYSDEYEHEWVDDRFTGNLLEKISA